MRPLGPVLALLLALALLVPAGADRAELRQLGPVVPVAGSSECRGARAFAIEGCNPLQRSGALTPTTTRAASDRPSVYERDCIAEPPAFRVKSCELALSRGRLHLALLGNSLASQWADAVRRIGRDHGWRVTTYLASSCAPSELGTARSSSARCRAWGRDVRSRMIRQGVDVVLVTSGSAVFRDKDQAEEGYLDYLRPLTTAGVLVESLRATPHPSRSLRRTVPDCVRANPRDYLRCSDRREAWLEPDPAYAAGGRLRRDRSGRIDLTDRMCTARTCVAAAGGFLLYRDGLHLTNAYVATLRPYLDQRLLAAIRADR